MSTFRIDCVAVGDRPRSDRLRIAWWPDRARYGGQSIARAKGYRPRRYVVANRAPWRWAIDRSRDGQLARG